MSHDDHKRMKIFSATAKVDPGDAENDLCEVVRGRTAHTSLERHVLTLTVVTP